MKRYLPLFFAFAIASCATAQAPSAQPSLEVQLSVLKERLFVLIEAERRRLNEEARPLILDPELMRAAQTHSQDMAMKSSFDAENPDGNVAINLLLGDPRFRGFVAENAAAQYFTRGTPIDPDASARAFLDIWLKSASHRMNLSYGSFQRTGIGIAVNGNTIYATTLFATDLGLPEPGLAPP